MTVKLSLIINDTPISTDYFVEGFIDHVVSGIIESLEDTGKIKELDLSINDGNVIINLNGTIVSTNPFASKIIQAQSSECSLHLKE